LEILKVEIGQIDFERQTVKVKIRYKKQVWKDPLQDYMA
jgi:hypothetical protein